MLTREENELLVRVGPGAPMGDLFRRFWTPALLSSELPKPDDPPVRVDILGEQLVAFRDTDGKLGLVSAFCAHRRANLFWGRNEDRGIRCVYHGWKFDVDGACVDIPNAPEGEKIKHKMGITSYPTVERGGIVWAYLGPKELTPDSPACEIFNVPADHIHVVKMVVKANWLQLTEGDVDSSHVSFLHSTTDGKPLLGSRLTADVYSDRAPKWIVTETDYGLMLAARRGAGPDNYAWRINQWLMPYSTLVAGPADAPILSQTRCPIDDEHSMLFRVFAHPSRPLTDEERTRVGNGVIFPEMVPGTFTTKENETNDYLIDRAAQKSASFTGIRSISAQDLAVTQLQGGSRIVDRSLERLVSSDTAIVSLRRRLLQAVKELQKGKEPAEARNAAAYRVRPIDVVLPRQVDVIDGTRLYTKSSSSAEVELTP